MYVVFVERDRSWMNVCNMPFHMNETSEQNRQQYFEEVKSELKNKCHTEKMRGRRTASKDVLHRSTYCIFLQEYCFLLKGVPCIQGNFLKKWNVSKEQAHKKNEGKAELD